VTLQPLQPPEPHQQFMGALEARNGMLALELTAKGFPW
jgi:hypothetical protein